MLVSLSFHRVQTLRVEPICHRPKEATHNSYFYRQLIVRHRAGYDIEASIDQVIDTFGDTYESLRLPGDPEVCLCPLCRTSGDGDLRSPPMKNTPPKLRPTRWLDTLAYRCEEPGLWRIYDITDTPARPVGPQYRSKDELLADLERYAAVFGCH